MNPDEAQAQEPRLPSLVIRDGSPQDKKARRQCLESLCSSSFPNQGTLRARLDVIRERARPELLSVEWESTDYIDCWVRPDDVVLEPKRTAPPGEPDWFPYHHSPDELATITYEDMRGNPDTLMMLGSNLWLQAISHPYGTALYVTINGNHRSAGAAMAGLPYMPAKVSMVEEVTTRLGDRPHILSDDGKYRIGPYRYDYSFERARWNEAQHVALHLIEADGLISNVEGRRVVGEPTADFTYRHNDSAIPWIVGWNLLDAPTGIEEYEGRYGPLTDPRYDWLRSHRRIGERLAQHHGYARPNRLAQLLGTLFH